MGFAPGLGLSDMAGGAGRWVMIAGTWLRAALLALCVAALAEIADRPAAKIGLRVVASLLVPSTFGNPQASN